MARELFRCTVCDKDIEKKGRYGHVKFSDGDGHGPKGEVPDDAEDYFIRVDEDARENAKEQAEESDEDSDEDSDEGNGGDETESSDDSPNPDDEDDSGNADAPEPTETDDGTGDKRSLKELLTTPINELL